MPFYRRPFTRGRLYLLSYLRPQSYRCDKLLASLPNRIECPHSGTLLDERPRAMNHGPSRYSPQFSSPNTPPLVRRGDTHPPLDSAHCSLHFLDLATPPESGDGWIQWKVLSWLVGDRWQLSPVLSPASHASPGLKSGMDNGRSRGADGCGDGSPLPTRGGVLGEEIAGCSGKWAGGNFGIGGGKRRSSCLTAAFLTLVNSPEPPPTKLGQTWSTPSTPLRRRRARRFLCHSELAANIVEVHSCCTRGWLSVLIRIYIH